MQKLNKIWGTLLKDKDRRVDSRTNGPIIAISKIALKVHLGEIADFKFFSTSSAGERQV